MIFEDLDSQQRDVATAASVPRAKVLVTGGPGTGKTTAALWAGRTFLDSTELGPGGRVLFLTFSRAAVSQITSRSPGIVGDHGARIEVMTFHGLAFQMLKSFGRYAGLDSERLSIQSAARRKLFGPESGTFTYDDLIPAARGVVSGSARIRQLLSSRWGLVICDEVQDTSAEQWQFLRSFATNRTLLLGDENQMIYTFVPGVSPEQFGRLREWVDKEIALSPQSYRDPSGSIPALAESIRQRNFNGAAVTDAIENQRLLIHRDIDDQYTLQLLCQIINDARQKGVKDIGIFVHSNAAVADIADGLGESGIDYVLIGIPEAHAEALSTMATQCAFGLGLATREDVRRSLALFVVASTRGRDTPAIALSLLGRGTSPLPQLVQDALHALEQELQKSADGRIEELMMTAMQSWEKLLIEAGRSTWRRAATHFWRIGSGLRNVPASADRLRVLLDRTEQARAEALIDFDYSERGTVKLMNYHQTKGREADTVVHVFRAADYFGNDAEPYAETSKLLNVAISRARKQVIIILPRNPHPLVSPFLSIVPPDARWQQTVRELMRVKGNRYNLGALLRDCRPNDVHPADDGTLIVPFTHAANLHRMEEELLSLEVRNAVEQAIASSYGISLAFKVVLANSSG